MDTKAAQTAIDFEMTRRLRTVIGQLARGLRRTRAGAQLTTTETSVLATATRVGPVGLSQLAEQEGMNPTMLSRVVRRLEEEGLIVRHVDDEDRRAAFVVATPAGRQLQQQIHAERSDAINQFAAGLSGDHRQALNAALPILEQLAEHVKSARL